MPNLTSVLNEQIRRLARRETTGQTKKLRRLNAQHRRDIAALKRQVAGLLKTVGFLETQEKRRVVQQPVVQESGDIRFRADGLRSHRSSLGLSARDYGRLVGVSGLTIYSWEAGKSRPRQQQVAKVAAVRGIGKREAMKRLQLLSGTAGRPAAAVTGAGAPRRRRVGGQTAKEFVLALVKSKKATTTAQINGAWAKAGRPGRSNNTLGLLVREGTLKRAELKNGRGSRYQ
jgi:DNA-binding transcriptional regulator YiaG